MVQQNSVSNVRLARARCYYVADNYVAVAECELYNGQWAQLAAGPMYEARRRRL